MATVWKRTNAGKSFRSRLLAANGRRHKIGMCQQITRTLARLGSVGDVDRDGDADAVDAIKRLKAQGRFVRETNPDRIPGGVLVYWSGGSRGHGHVAGSYARGRVMSSDFPSGRMGKVKIRDVKRQWPSMRLEGFAPVGWDGTVLSRKVRK